MTPKSQTLEEQVKEGDFISQQLIKITKNVM